ncbi:hypothetical protein [Virgibacillus kimchii]
MRKLTSFVLLLAVTVILVFVVSNDTTNADRESEPVPKEDIETNRMDNDERPDLAARGKDGPIRYPTNDNLRLAHTEIAVITYNASFNNGGKPINQDLFQDHLYGVKGLLTAIQYDGEKKDELQKAIDLTNQAIEQNAGKGDPILDDIHQIVHDLLEYFDGEAKDIEVDETGVPINEEDKTPGIDYSKK